MGITHIFIISSAYGKSESYVLGCILRSGALDGLVVGLSCLLLFESGFAGGLFAVPRLRADECRGSWGLITSVSYRPTSLKSEHCQELDYYRQVL